MLPGFNHNIRYREESFHVQTEDNGLKHPLLVTQVFHSGTLIAIQRTDYSDILERALPDKARNDQIRTRMQDQHKHMLKSLVSGGFDEKIDVLFGIAAAEPAPVPAAAPRTPAAEPAKTMLDVPRLQTGDLNSAPPRRVARPRAADTVMDMPAARRPEAPATRPPPSNPKVAGFRAPKPADNAKTMLDIPAADVLRELAARREARAKQKTAPAKPAKTSGPSERSPSPPSARPDASTTPTVTRPAATKAPKSGSRARKASAAPATAKTPRRRGPPPPSADQTLLEIPAAKAPTEEAAEDDVLSLDEVILRYLSE